MKLNATMAGMATTSPSSVVKRAVEIPSASSFGFGEVVDCAMTWKLAIIPCTVPSSPSMGAMVPMSDR
jgi:hypothetical protein